MTRSEQTTFGFGRLRQSLPSGASVHPESAMSDVKAISGRREMGIKYEHITTAVTGVAAIDLFSEKRWTATPVHVRPTWA